MTVPNDRQVQIVLDRVIRALAGKRPAQHGAAKPRGDLHVAEGRHVQVDPGGAEDSSEQFRSLRNEEVFEKGRGVGDDDPQEASLAARSTWIRSAAGPPSLTGGLASILSKTSSAGGLATSRSRSSWM
jgi:hypothetical protein